MSDREHKQWAEWVFDQVANVNPYNRQGLNIKNEFYLYQAGFLAAYLASLMREDPWIQRRFARHLNKVNSAKKP